MRWQVRRSGRCPGSARRTGQRLGGSAADQERITALEEQLAQARAAAGAAAAGELSAAQTKELAASAPSAGYVPVPARVVSSTAVQDPVRSVAVSAGSGQGISPGLAVIAAEGLAGIVDSVSPQVATVRLVVDPATEVAARVASSGEIGVFRGTGSAGRFELLDPLGAMAAGDLLITLGTPSRDLPAGLPLGRVTAVTGSSADLTRAAEVAPAVDASTLDRVLVLVPGRRGEGNAVTRERPVSRGAVAAMVLGLVALALVQVSMLDFLPTPWAVPDLVVVAVLALAIARGPLVGGMAGAWAGLVLDLIPPAARGLWGLDPRARGGWSGARPGGREYRPGPVAAMALLAATAGDPSCSVRPWSGSPGHRRREPSWARRSWAPCGPSCSRRWRCFS